MTDLGHSWMMWFSSPQLRSIVDELASATPRAAATLAGALLDDLLARLLVRSVIDDLPEKLEKDRDLTYYAKSTWAHRLGLISLTTLEDLRIHGNVRNRFAHSWDLHLTFDSHEIADLIIKLETPMIAMKSSPNADAQARLPRYVNKRGKIDIQARMSEIRSRDKRRWWVLSVMLLLTELRARGDTATPPPNPPDFGRNDHL